MRALSSTVLALVVLGVHAQPANEADLRRAKTRRPSPSSPLAADSHAGVFHSINNHLHGAGLPTRPCEAHNHAELIQLINHLVSRRDGQLQELYLARVDRRAMRPLAGMLKNETDVSRDSLCAHTVMLWAHHLSGAVRQELSADPQFSLPLMPAAGPRANGDALYKELVSCVNCHYIGGKDADSAEARAPQVAGGPPLPIWGGAKQFRVEVNMTDVSDSPRHPTWHFKYFYDAMLKADRYEHAEGQYDEVCGRSRSKKPCTVINSGDTKRYLKYDGKCWVQSGFLPGMGGVAVRSDWLQNGGASYVGPTTVRGIAVNEWLKYGASDNHYYATADRKQLPVRYMEHKNGKLKQWDFDLTTYSAGPQKASLFSKPDRCTHRFSGEDATALLV